MYNVVPTISTIVATLIGIHSCYKIMDPLLYSYEYEPVIVHVPPMNGIMDMYLEQLEPVPKKEDCMTSKRNFCRQCWHDTQLDSSQWIQACAPIRPTECHQSYKMGASYLIPLRTSMIKPDYVQIEYMDGHMVNVSSKLLDIVPDQVDWMELNIPYIELNRVEWKVEEELDRANWGEANMMNHVSQLLRPTFRTRDIGHRFYRDQLFNITIVQQQWNMDDQHMIAIVNQYGYVVQLVDNEYMAKQQLESIHRLPIHVIKVSISTIILLICYWYTMKTHEFFSDRIHDYDDHEQLKKIV